VTIPLLLARSSTRARATVNRAGKEVTNGNGETAGTGRGGRDGAVTGVIEMMIEEDVRLAPRRVSESSTPP
jgi:hypothetical protein